MRILLLLAWLVPFGAWAQSMAITGKVTDADDGMGLPGVSVVEKGTYNGTVTDLDGNYTLMVSTPEATLTFTYIGYKTTDVALAGRTAVDHALAADIAGLEEAIVIGYGNQQRSKISGAVGTIDIKDATAVPVLRTEQALQGRRGGPGDAELGRPGSTQSIRIRGTGSLNNAEPLWVVDGIPTGGIDFLNPADIESISVLKDAASAAIYGARGGNGDPRDDQEGRQRPAGPGHLRRLLRHAGALEESGLAQRRAVRHPHEREPRCGRIRPLPRTRRPGQPR